MKRPKVYIAGKISGLTIEEYTTNFTRAADAFRKLGFEVYNPCDYVSPSATWIEAMRKCVNGLATCDYIYMQRNWTASKGAIIERLIAYILKIDRIKITAYENQNPTQ